MWHSDEFKALSWFPLAYSECERLIIEPIALRWIVNINVSRCSVMLCCSTFVSVTSGLYRAARRCTHPGVADTWERHIQLHPACHVASGLKRSRLRSWEYPSTDAEMRYRQRRLTSVERFQYVIISEGVWQTLVAGSLTAPSMNDIAGEHGVRRPATRRTHWTLASLHVLRTKQ